MSELLHNSSLAILCPMANERETAVDFVREILEQASGLREVRFLAVLDHASTDGTLELLREYARRERRLQVVWAPEDRCVVDAYVVGYREALKTKFEWILEIDAGFSHQPRDLPKFLSQLAPGVDCVFGSRFCPGGRITETPWKRRLLSRGGTILANLMLGTHFADMTSGYELFHRDALEYVLKKGIHSGGHFFQTEIKFHCRNMRVIEVPIHYRAASNSVKGATVIDAFTNLFRLFRQRISASG